MPTFCNRTFIFIKFHLISTGWLCYKIIKFGSTCNSGISIQFRGLIHHDFYILILGPMNTNEYKNTSTMDIWQNFVECLELKGDAFCPSPSTLLELDVSDCSDKILLMIWKLKLVLCLRPPPHPYYTKIFLIGQFKLGCQIYFWFWCKPKMGLYIQSKSKTLFFSILAPSSSFRKNFWRSLFSEKNCVFR